jgi:hypothetical protein
MIPLLLYVLATLDAAFCGYRAAAGRSALVDKRAYYRRALARGILAGQLAVLIAGSAIAAAWVSASDRAVLWVGLIHAGARMLAVYVPYAALLLAAFAVRAVPSVDVRSLTSTLVFGPFTLLRPFVVTVGLVYALVDSPPPVLYAIGALVAVMMLSLEGLLGRAVAPPA